MNTQSQVTPAFQVAAFAIKQDDQGRYCLNDLHRASGNAAKHQPSNWLANQQTKDLIAEFEKDSHGIPGLQTIKGTRTPGTYVVKELVYAYAMWISAAFALKVIRAYDALQHTALPAPADNTLAIDLDLPEGVKQLTLSFNSNPVLGGRWSLWHSGDRLVIKPMAQNEFVTTSEKLASVIGDSMGGAVHYKHLSDIVVAAGQRIGRAKS